jgi:hypothetical protein
MPDEPLRTTTFMLTRADALAYEQTASRMTPLGVLAFILWLGLWGCAALLIPTDWSGPRFGWAMSLLITLAIAIAAVLALLLVAVRQWLRARRRMPKPVEVTITEWPTRLETVGAGLPRNVPFTTIRESRLVPTHLFVITDETVLILPRHAFAAGEGIDDLAARIAGRPAPAVDLPGGSGLKRAP